MGIEEKCGVAYLLWNSINAGSGDRATQGECLELRDIRGAEERRHHKRSRAAIETGHIGVGDVTQKQDIVAKAALLDQMLNDRETVWLLVIDKHQSDIVMILAPSS